MVFLVLILIVLLISNGDQISAQKSTGSRIISRLQAIQIATRAGYYHEKEPWHMSTVVFDSIGKQWKISSSKSKHISKGPCDLQQLKKATCDCKNTNGCTEMRYQEIVINAVNRNVVKKKSWRKRYPNYE